MIPVFCTLDFVFYKIRWSLLVIVIYVLVFGVSMSLSLDLNVEREKEMYSIDLVYP